MTTFSEPRIFQLVAQAFQPVPTGKAKQHRLESLCHQKAALSPAAARAV
jgi:hypothetical protein